MNIVIIGAGPAGITCAIQLKRSGLDPVLMEKGKAGGLLHNAGRISNYPGFPEGITGSELGDRLKRQLDLHQVHVVNEAVLTVDHAEGTFTCKTRAKVYFADILVIASGTVPVSPGFSSPRIYTDVNDIRDKTNKVIGVIGAGDAAFDYALQLSRNAVTIFNRSERISAVRSLKNSVLDHPSITYKENHNLEATETRGEKIRASFSCGTKKSSHLMDYIIFAIGRLPAEHFMAGITGRLKQELMDRGALYAVGDVANRQFRQASIAAGDGMRAAMQIIFQIQNHERNTKNRTQYPGERFCSGR
ncbi:MAG: NAD(P)/FAD-dependent oxidoreductase [Bacteroidales bacterium]